MSDKKRKLNNVIDEVNEDNYLEMNLEDYKSNLYMKKIKYENEIDNLKKRIKEINYLISKKCLHKNKKHEWITEREPCMYGEKFTYCKNCKIDYYDKTYIH